MKTEQWTIKGLPTDLKERVRVDALEKRLKINSWVRQAFEDKLEQNMNHELVVGHVVSILEKSPTERRPAEMALVGALKELFLRE